MQLVSSSRDAEKELLTLLQTKFKSAYEENHSTESFYGNYLDILDCFLSVTRKYPPVPKQEVSQEYLDEMEDPKHNVAYEYYINRRYMSGEELPKLIERSLKLDDLSYMELRELCKKNFEGLHIKLTLKREELIRTLTNCNMFIMSYNGIDRSSIPMKTTGPVSIYNLRNLSKVDRLTLRRELKLKKERSLEMELEERKGQYRKLLELNTKKSTKEEIIDVLKNFADCDMKMRKEQLVSLVESNIQNIGQLI
jgi:hypothetical protein